MKIIAIPAIIVMPGLLPAQQAERFASIAPRMQEFVDQGEAAGIVTLIATRDRILHLGAVGKTDMMVNQNGETAKPSRPQANRHPYRASGNAVGSRIQRGGTACYR